MIIVLTPPQPVASREAICNTLLQDGLLRLHLRLPGASREEYEAFIEKIAPEFRERVVVHDHYELVDRYGLRGIHLPEARIAGFDRREEFRHVSVSCHSPEAIRQLPFRVEYAFLSPVFDSISKPGYGQAFDPARLAAELREIPVPVIALGGLDAGRLPQARKLGFSGGALLGYLWEHPGEAVERFRQLPPPEVVSIAGLDPSAGAGITSDCKTMAYCGAYGFTVCSAVTFQNESRYHGTRWVSSEEILQQYAGLLESHAPRYVKIGLIESLEVLEQVVERVVDLAPHTRIIWDPILKASAGFLFHRTIERSRLERILQRVFLITPNREELEALFPRPDDTGTYIGFLQEMARKYDLHILWKGGHNREEEVADRLISPDRIEAFVVPRAGGSKHGTGCVLSAAITAFLSRGYPLPEACRKGQRYVSGFISATPGALGVHRPAFAAPGLPDLAALPLQYITDPREGLSVEEEVEAVCRGGVRWVQLRMKGADTERWLRTGRAVQAICKRYGALFIINDRVDVALALQADGVHLGKEDLAPREARQLLGPNRIIGATCNTWEDMIYSHAQGADYLGVGPYRFTTTKKGLSPVLGLEGYRTLIRQARRQGVTLPIHAIGGIREEDFAPLMATGITGIALSSLIRNASDLTGKSREVVRQIHNTLT